MLYDTCASAAGSLSVPFVTACNPSAQCDIIPACRRKPVWARLQASAMRELLSSRFTPITQQQAYQRLSQRELGLAKLRLLPKTWGLRPIVNMGTNTTAVFRLVCAD